MIGLISIPIAFIGLIDIITSILLKLLKNKTISGKQWVSYLNWLMIPALCFLTEFGYIKIQGGGAYGFDILFYAGVFSIMYIIFRYKSLIK